MMRLFVAARFFAAVFGALFLLVLFHAPPAVAQAACGDRDKFVALLGDNYAEQPRASGLPTILADRRLYWSTEFSVLV